MMLAISFLLTLDITKYMTQPKKTNVPQATNVPTNKSEPGCLGCLCMIFILIAIFDGCSSLFTSDNNNSDNNNSGYRLSTKDQESLRRKCRDPEGDNPPMLHQECKDSGYLR